MTVNFSYRAIPNSTLDLNGGHFSKWPPEHVSISQFLNHLENDLGV